MKNYSLNKMMEQDFILNYVIVGDKIIINYANGDVDTLGYSIENEKNILNKMKYQVLNSKHFSSFLNYKFEIFLKLFMDVMLLFVLFIITFFVAEMSYITALLGMSIFSVSIALTGYKLNSYQKLRNDIKKQLLFLKNEDNLNLVIRNNPEVIRKLNSKICEKVITNESNNFRFTLNTIDRMEYKELKQVYGYVEEKDNIKDVKKKRKIRLK